MIEDRSLKRLRKKPEDVCGGGLWGRLRSTVRTSTRRPRSLSGSVPFENAEVAEMRDWDVDHRDIPSTPAWCGRFWNSWRSTVC
jgi:hypothetical protein